MFKTDRAVHPYHHEPESDSVIKYDADIDHWFVAVVSNPCRYKTRYALFRKFRDHIRQDLKANLLVVECALGDRSLGSGIKSRTTWKCRCGTRHSCGRRRT